jgi:hypothetical protein
MSHSADVWAIDVDSQSLLAISTDIKGSTANMNFVWELLKEILIQIDLPHFFLLQWFFFFFNHAAISDHSSDLRISTATFLL